VPHLGTILYLALVAMALGAGVLAVRSRSLITSAIALAVGTSCIAGLFFLLRAPYAGAVQLSVGAGLVSTLFLIAIGLTESIRGGGHDQ